MEVPSEAPTSALAVGGEQLILPLTGAAASNFENFEEYPLSADESGPTLDAEKEALHFGNW